MKTTDMGIRDPETLPLNGWEFAVADAFPVKIVLHTYTNGRLAIELLDEEGDSYATLTTNLVDEDLTDGEIFVKTWSENEEAAAGALASGLFKDTGRRVQAGHAEAQVWTIVDPLPRDREREREQIERETRIRFQHAISVSDLAKRLAVSPFAQGLDAADSPEQAVKVLYDFAEALVTERERRLKAAKEEP